MFRLKFTATIKCEGNFAVTLSEISDPDDSIHDFMTSLYEKIDKFRDLACEYGVLSDVIISAEPIRDA